MAAPSPIPTNHVDRIDAGIAAGTEREVERARATMARWQDFRGLTPFGNMNSGHACDRANSYLSEAGSLLNMLSAAFEDRDTLLGKRAQSVFDERCGAIMAGALEGVATLIDLATFAAQ